MHLRTILPLAVTTTLSAQNDVLYYKFEGGGTKAVNYATGSPAPGQGTIVNLLTTAPTSSYVAGRFGSALNSGIQPAPLQRNYVDTGWAPNVTSSYTWSMWLRNSRGTPAGGTNYVVGIPTSLMFRIYTGSSILLTTGNAGGTTAYSTLANVYAMATAGWMHIAFVVDTTTMTATYYINGVPEAPRVLTGLPSIVGTAFNVGSQITTLNPSIYEIDEFRFITRAATPAEITTWSTVNTAGTGAFGAGCDASLAPVSGLPQIGNLLYGFMAMGQPNAVGFMTLGFSRNAFGAIALPADLGLFIGGMSGCQWECSSEATLLTILDPSGMNTRPFPIPPLAQYDGLEIFAQGLFIGGPRGMSTTNPVVASIGN